MSTAALGRARIEYRLVGRHGDPTVLVHGSWTDGEVWNEVVAPLAQGLVVLSYDRRGYGASEGPAPRRPVREDSTDLAQLLESIDLFPAHLIGQGFGGVVALRLAVDRPELVRSVVAHDLPFLELLEENPVCRPEAEEAIAELRRDQTRVRAGEGTEVARERWDREAGEPGAWDRIEETRRNRWVLTADRWALERDDPESLRPDRSELSGLDLPVLLTTGERSLPLYERIGAQLVEILRNSSARTLPGVGHQPQLTAPGTFVGTIVSFLLERDVPST